MNLHEHQAKALFREFSIPVPDGDAAFSVAEAVSIANLLGATPNGSGKKTSFAIST